MKGDIYYKKVRGREKIILSEDFSMKLIERLHEDFCHIGIKQIQKKISQYYTGKNLEKNIKRICKSCKVCIKNKSRGRDKIGLMSHLGPAKKLFEIMSMDTIGGFGGSRSTKNYLHLLVDHFTRYAYIRTSKNQSANDFIRLVNDVAANNEIGMILADQYPGINSREFKNFLKEENIPIVFTAVDSPFSNGLNERLNQTLVNRIRCKMNGEERKRAWTTIAHECVQKYNETEHTVTGFAPKYLLEGTDVGILPKEIKPGKTEAEWKQDRERALAKTILSHNYNKHRFDKNRKNFNFKVGDMVFVENGNRMNRKKMDELRLGPYKIIEKVSNSIYKINTGHRKSESNFFHVTKLIPSEEEEEENEDSN